MRMCKATAALLVSTVVMLPAARAAYPDKPIRLVIGSAPGSGPDIISRLLSDRLYASWGQRIVVDSRPGVAGLISADIVTRAVPDGYTWMMLTSQLFVATNVFTNHKIDLQRDFQSISLIGSVPFVLSMNPQVPAKSVQELIELARQSKPALRYGSSGAGTTEHLCGVLFTRLAKVDMLHVPYKGIAQALADTVAREVHLSFAVLPAARPMVQAGRLRAMGVTTLKRSPALPDVPAIAETLPGYELYGWYSLVAPTGTPKAVLDKVNAEVVKAVKEPAFGEHLKNIGVSAIGTSRSEFDAFRAEQARRTIDLVKASGVKVQ
jgi:tripartite-type tricarboxylate transporter receptor subunit TctC